jgi:hypothetical protein
MEFEHECWWTRRHETELSDTGLGVTGAGVLRRVLERTASLLGAGFGAEPSGSDEDGQAVVLNPIASGATHDGCLFHLEPVSPELKGALLQAVLELHSAYLDSTVEWSQACEQLLVLWTSGVTLRIRTSPRQRQVVVRRYPDGAGILRRLVSPRVRINCASGVGLLV